MDLCHEKHAEQHLPDSEKNYTGRVVFRGDNVKDEQGCDAVFSEQGTSASHMSAAKFLDAIARMPGHSGGNADAVGAYTHANLDPASHLLGGTQQKPVETWITLPPSRRPTSWCSIEFPVCKLKLNLYGHPVAGLIWELYCRHAILELGFEPVKSWECLYVHRQKGLFLSVYVDDFKMAGRAT